MSAAVAELVSSLAGNYASHAASRVLNVALTTGDEMNMRVANSLSSRTAVVHADVKTTDRSVLRNNFVPH